MDSWYPCFSCSAFISGKFFFVLSWLDMILINGLRLFFGCNDIWSAKDQIHMHYWLSLFGQDGWKLTNFFSCVFSWMETKSRLTQKKGTRQISSYLDQQTWSIEYSLLSKKNFTLIRIKNDFFFFFWELGKKGGHVPNKINPQVI